MCVWVYTSLLCSCGPSISFTNYYFFIMEYSNQALDDLISMKDSLSCDNHVLELDLSNYVEPSVTAKKLLLKIMGIRKYNPWLVKNVMVKVWSFDHEFQVHRGSPGVCIVIFQKEEQLPLFLRRVPKLSIIILWFSIIGLLIRLYKRLSFLLWISGYDSMVCLNELGLTQMLLV